MFHVFFGGIAVFAMPAAAIAALDLWERARDKGRGGLAVAILILITIQLEIGVVAGVFRLYKFGPNDYEPIPIALLEAINRLPSGAKIAYSCQPLRGDLSLGVASYQRRRAHGAAHDSNVLSVGILRGADRHGDLPECSKSALCAGPATSLVPRRGCAPVFSGGTSFRALARHPLHLFGHHAPECTCAGRDHHRAVRNSRAAASPVSPILRSTQPPSASRVDHCESARACRISATLTSHDCHADRFPWRHTTRPPHAGAP